MNEERMRRELYDFYLQGDEVRARTFAERCFSILDGRVTDGMSVTEVAAHLGFSSVAYFSRFFKKHVGLSPSAFAEQSREL